MTIEYPSGGDTAALVKHAMTFRKGASVPGSGDGAVRFRARNDIGCNGKKQTSLFINNCSHFFEGSESIWKEVM